MNVSNRTPVRAKKGHARRSHWMRWLALVLSLLGLFAQQRVLAPTLRPHASVVRQIAERAQSRETHAVRAEPALRVAAAPVFARDPWFPEHTLPWPRQSARAREVLAPLAADQSRAPLSHFHSRRRIPRMNSEEPPRA